MNNQEYLFEGICEGEIIIQQKGLKGFGYDPVFVPNGSDKTFAEMTKAEKNQISMRKIAIQKLRKYLSQEYGHE